MLLPYGLLAVLQMIAVVSFLSEHDKLIHCVMYRL